MQTVIIQISDNDYQDLVNHIARGHAGHPLVAVVGLVQDAQPADVHADIKNNRTETQLVARTMPTPEIIEVLATEKEPSKVAALMAELAKRRNGQA